MSLKVQKKMKDFASKELYGEFVLKAVDKGSVVRMRVNYPDVKKGELGTVDHKDGDVSNVLCITFSGKLLQVYSYHVDVVTSVLR